MGIEHSLEKVREVLLWHEFFHVLEFQKIGLVGEKFCVPRKVLFFIINRPFYPISEISANAFAKQVMGLAYNPFLFDYLMQNPSQCNFERVGE